LAATHPAFRRHKVARRARECREGREPDTWLCPQRL
jgi:hypothetical protein